MTATIGYFLVILALILLQLILISVLHLKGICLFLKGCCIKNSMNGLFIYLNKSATNVMRDILYLMQLKGKKMFD